MNRIEADNAIREYGDLSRATAAANARLAELEKQIKDYARENGAIAAHGVTVTVKPGTTRATWDGKGLAGYAVANPEVLAFYSETITSPAVSIRVRRIL